MSFTKLFLIGCFFISAVVTVPIQAQQDLSSILATEEEALSPLVDLELFADMLKQTHAHSTIHHDDLDNLMSRFHSFMGLNLGPLVQSLRNMILQRGFIKLEVNLDPLASYKDVTPLNDPSYIFRVHSMWGNAFHFPLMKEQLVLSNIIDIKSIRWDSKKEELIISVKGFHLDDQAIKVIKIDVHQEIKAELANGKEVSLPLLELYSDFYYNHEQEVSSLIEKYTKIREFPLPVLIHEAMKFIEWFDVELRPSRFTFFASTSKRTREFLLELADFLKPKNELASKVLKNIDSFTFKGHRMMMRLHKEIDFKLGRRGVALDKDVSIYMHDKHRFEPLYGFSGFVGGEIMKVKIDIEELMFSPDYQILNTQVNVLNSFQFQMPTDLSTLELKGSR